MVKLRYKWCMKILFWIFFIVLVLKWSYTLNTGYYVIQRETFFHISGFKRNDSLRTKSNYNETSEGNLPKINLTLPDITSAHENITRTLEVNMTKMNFTLPDMVSEHPNTTFEFPWGKPSKKCVTKVYGRNQCPEVSVVISFHDKENVTDIIHTVHSILQRSPRECIKEILLVDDNTQRYVLNTLLPEYLQSLSPKVRFIRRNVSLGLIQARHTGILHSEGEVVVVMDSHMEVQVNWLDALLDILISDSKALVSSYLDWISEDSKGKKIYKIGGSSWKTYFDWNLKFGFQEMSGSDRQKHSLNPTQPVRTPVIVGTIWAMWKSFYHELGGMDTGMQGWGGENIELPLKVWLFGGKVYNVPCSHAAHIERQGSRSYRSTWWNKINNNYKRIVDVWFDSFKDVFYFYNPTTNKIPAENITDRLAIKTKAKYGFDWFLTNVYPELGVYNSNSLAHGGIRNIAVDKCLTFFFGSSAFMSRCSSRRGSVQGFYLSSEGELRFPVHVFNSRGYNEQTYKLISEEYITAYQKSTNSRWIHSKGGQMMLHQTEYCLTVHKVYNIRFTKCNATDVNQQWEFLCYTSDYRTMGQTLAPSADTKSGKHQDYFLELSKTISSNDRGNSSSHKMSNISGNCRLSW